MKWVKKILEIVLWGVLILSLLYFGLRVLVCDKFTINGESMFPLYESGDVIWVNKILAGPRIYSSFDFSSPELSSFRLPGIRKLKVGDVVVFNNPFGRNRSKIEFRINYVYAKRILGCPGDTIGIDDAFYYNLEYKGQFGDKYSQELLSNTEESDLGYDIEAFPRLDELGWTIYDMGPLTVPRRGMKVGLDYINTRIYALAIEYETGMKPVWKDGCCLINGEVRSIYEFTKDYYYLVGDNVINSLDSRCFGFVPEEYIVGVAVAKSRKK